MKTVIFSIVFISIILIGFIYSKKKENEKLSKLNTSGHETKNLPQEIVELKYFGEIDLNKTEEYNEVQVNINGTEFWIDLNIIEDQISKKTIEPTVKFLNNLSEIVKAAQNQIKTDFDNDNVVKGYIRHHIGEFNNEELKYIGIESSDNSENQNIKFLNKIHLKRIGFYPEEWDSLAIFDFTINDDFTQYLIVLKFDSNQKFIDIYTES